MRTRICFEDERHDCVWFQRWRLVFTGMVHVFLIPGFTLFFVKRASSGSIGMRVSEVRSGYLVTDETYGRMTTKVAL